MSVDPIRWEWCSLKQEQAFYAQRHLKLLLVGGMGSGKSVVQARRIIKYLMDYPGARFMIVRRVHKQMKQTIMRIFDEELPNSYLESRNDTEGTRKLKNGSEVYFVHLDAPGSSGALLSLDLNGVYFEEASEIDEKQFDLGLRRIARWHKVNMPEVPYDWKWRTREGKPIPEPMVLLSTNPGDDEGHWIFRRFYDESIERREKKHKEIGADGQPTGNLVSYADMGYVKIDMPSYENRFLSAENLQGLYAAGDVDRYVEGKWGKRQGQIHKIHKDSLIPGTMEMVNTIRMRCKLARVFDHGSTGVTCVGWFGIDSDGNVYAFREYYMPDKRISEHREAIFGMSEHERYSENLADPSIFAHYVGKGGIKWSVAEEYSEKGTINPRTAIAWSKANNDEFGTRNRIQEFLAFDHNHINPFTGKRGSPRVFFLLRSEELEDGIVQMHRQIEAQRREQLDDGTFINDRDEKIVDHAYDVFRYYIAARQPLIGKKQFFPPDSIGADIHRRISDARKKEQSKKANKYGI